MNRRRSLPNPASIAAAAVVLFALAACTAGSGATPPPSVAPTGSPGPSTPPGAIAHPTGPTDLVLRITVDGGFAGPGWDLRRIPVISIYGDGTVISEGPQIEIYPPPALPSIVVARMTEAGLQEVLAAAQAAGLLGPDRTLDAPGIADAPFTTIVVNAGGSVHTTTIYALAEAEGSSVEIPAEEKAARREILDFTAKLSDRANWLGDELGADTQYAYDAMRIYSLPATPPVDGSVGGDENLPPSYADWPLEPGLAWFGDAFASGMNYRCGTITGKDLKEFLPVAQNTSWETYWRSGGSTYQLILRPLLPDESGCPTS
jgi:hypothetical protein